MNLNATRTRLEMLSKELLRAWAETRNSWRDAKAEEFERNYLQELSVRVEKSAAAFDKLNQLLTKVREDCE